MPAANVRIILVIRLILTISVFDMIVPSQVKFNSFIYLFNVQHNGWRIYFASIHLTSKEELKNVRNNGMQVKRKLILNTYQLAEFTIE